MSQTETETANSPADEQIRKIYAKDLKNGETVHTVFRATRKEKAASRAGKPYLALTLTDRTGEVDGRVFENADAADGAFAQGDYLLLKGRVGQFHGKLQIVIDRLERLDPEPIDPKEFEFTAPPAPAHEPKEEKKPRDRERTEDGGGEHSHKAARQRLLKLLDNPTIALGLDALLSQLEKQIEDRVVARLSGQPLPTTSGPKVEKKPRAPRPERHDAPKSESHKPEAPKRDGALPEGLAFKPFKALVGEGENSPSGS